MSEWIELVVCLRAITEYSYFVLDGVPAEGSVLGTISTMKFCHEGYFLMYFVKSGK